MALAPPRTADGVLEDAHRRAYRFPDGFAGFTADVAWETDDEHGSGAVDVALTGADVDITTDAPDWVARQLSSIVSHRAARPYADGDGALDKELGEDGPLGAHVSLADSMDSSYVVGSEGIELVTRTHGGSRFTIAIQQRELTDDGRHLPTAFTVAFWSLDGTLVASEAHSDAYVRLDGTLVPGTRTIVRADDSGLSVRKLVLSNHEARS